MPGPFPPLTVTLMDAKGKNMACFAYFEYGEDIAQKKSKRFFAQKKLAKWTAKKQKASAFVPQYFITFTPCCSYLQV